MSSSPRQITVFEAIRLNHEFIGSVETIEGPVNMTKLEGIFLWRDCRYDVDGEFHWTDTNCLYDIQSRIKIGNWSVDRKCIVHDTMTLKQD